MNRSVLARQMFARGGAALKPIPASNAGLPNLPKSVRNNMGYMQYGGAVGMQMGGDPAMAQGVGSMMPPPPAMPPAQGPMGDAQAVDPQVLQGLLNEASQSIGDLDEAEDYETVINSIRGEEASIEERYEELASVVGEEDAAQTPESVLALTQPAIMMGAVDQGIGGLAAEEMTQPVEGAMAQGIMSSVAPPPPAAPPMDPAMMGGPPPVNFNQGGLVRRGDNQPVQMYDNGGEATPLQTAYEGRLPLYKSIVGDPTAQLEEQQKLTKANMLFDIANTALAFAAPMQGETPGMSAAERLAMAAQKTQLLPTIGARAQQQLDAKKAATAAEQKMKLGALGAAEADVTAQAAAAAKIAEKKLAGSQKIAEIGLKAKLDAAMAKSLESQKQSGALTLQEARAQSRINLEGILQNNREAQERLRQSGVEVNTILANELEQENIVLRGNIKLGQMGVAHTDELERMEKGNEYAVELNKTNNALKEKLTNLDIDIKNRRLDLDNQKALVDAALGQEKIELSKELNRMTEEMNTFEKQYKTDKLDLDRAAARLTRMGTKTDARTGTLMADQKLMTAYAMGMTGKDETAELDTFIGMFASPRPVWNEDQKKMIESQGQRLPKHVLNALEMRRNAGLSYPNIDLDEARRKAGLTAPKPEEEELSTVVESLIMKDVEVPTAGFGSGAFVRDLANTVGEAFLLGAPATKTKDAVAATETLNTKFLQVFQRSAELRDSVFQAKEIQKLQPKPAKFWSGEEAAQSQIKGLLGMIGEAKQSLNQKLEELPLDSKQYTEAKGYLLDMDQLEAGYKIFQNYGQALNSKTNQQKVDEASNFLFGG